MFLYNVLRTQAANPTAPSPNSPLATAVPNQVIPDLRRQIRVSGTILSIDGVTCDTQDGTCTCNGQTCPDKYDGNGANCPIGNGQNMICACTAICGPTGGAETSSPTFTGFSGDLFSTNTFFSNGNNVLSTVTSGSTYYLVMTGSTIATLTSGAGSVQTGSPWWTMTTESGQSGGIIIQDGKTVGGAAATSSSSGGAAAPTGQSRELAMAGIAGIIGAVMAL